MISRWRLCEREPLGVALVEEVRGNFGVERFAKTNTLVTKQAQKQVLLF